MNRGLARNRELYYSKLDEQIAIAKAIWMGAAISVKNYYGTGANGLSQLPKTK
jgi:hypothetical protein